MKRKDADYHGSNAIKYNLKVIALILFVFGLLLTFSVFISAYARSVPAYTFGHQTYDLTGNQGFPVFDRSMCQAGQDFILQIDPLGCVNAPVRSDLLEEQEVAVFCPIVATQLNPLIEVEDLDRITLSLQDRPEEVLTVGYYPARAALGTGKIAEVTTPVLGNIGYAVIVLKQQRNESAMPDFVQGNITARMIYDIENAFGTGRSVFYLPQLSDTEFNRDYRAYSFWDGKGYLRLEGADNEGATVGIYSDRDISGVARTGEKTLVSRVNLEKGKVSGEIYIPGFDYCLGRLRLKLVDVENPDTMARFRIDSEIIEVKEGEKFLENKCALKNIKKQGIIQKTEINCVQDTKRGDITFTVSPRVNISINGEIKAYGIGDFLYRNGGNYVFLGFMGSSSSVSESEENLYIRLLSIPGEKIANKQKLSEDEISYMASYNNALHNSDIKKGILGEGAENLRQIGAKLFDRAKKFFGGNELEFLRYVDQEKDIFGSKIRLLGYSGAYDTELSDLPEDVEKNYGNAISDYGAVTESFSGEKYPAGSLETLGQQVLREEIRLAWQIGQRTSVTELCDFYENNYGEPVEPECTSAYLLSNTEISVESVLIEGATHLISFEKIKEPSYEEFGAKITVRYPDNNATSYEFSKDEILYLNDTTNEFIQLIDIKDDGSVTLRTNLDLAERKAINVISDALLRDTRATLKKGIEDDFKGKYTFSLLETNLKKDAKVSIEPEVDYARANATFNFKIGIDKRDIQLSPEKTKERIESLNSTVEKFQKISDTLGKVVSVGKRACLATSVALTLKNFWLNLGGKGIARQTVMRGDSGWYDKCKDAVNSQSMINGKGPFNDVESCLLENSDAIDKSVSAYETAISQQNEIGLTLQGINDNYRTGISSDVQDIFAENKITVADKQVPLTDILPYINNNTISLSQARDLQLNARILDSSDANAREIAKSNVEKILGEVYSNSRAEATRQTLATAYGINTIIGATKELKKYDVYQVNTFSQVRDKFSGANIPESKYVSIFADQSDGKKYLLVFNNDYLLEQTYSIGESGVLSVAVANNTNPLQLSLTPYDATSYDNKYQNAEVRYYETAPYEGVPAVVPFDVQKGWYAAIKSTLPVLGGLRAYDDSGVVRSFYVCNVGKNGREEFISGDDICRGFVPGTGQSPKFTGLSDRDSERLMEEAVRAIEQASRADRTKAYVTINGQRIKVGEPAFNLPDIQCEDFMSPADCNFMFNVCDPVVCPSSRCDLGGAYPVKDVVQSGVIGSLFLCLPNWPEVKVPICVSGVHAGIEGWTSVLESYQQCLQTSLDTGETVGICDELNSVYMCEFFWRQGLPAAKYAIKQGLGAVLGQGSRGGGEYLRVQDALETAEQSVDYFTQYYAANSFEAFKARTAESVGTDVCKQFISLTTPDGGSLIDALTAPDSPVQFYGRFEEFQVQTITNPPSSQYKVFYHIFAGRDFPAYYQVYLRGTGGSFFQDAGARRIVAGGFIKAGEFSTSTEDFTAPSGYKELCIVVNGQEECGFKEVTTEFGLNYLTESYVAKEAANTDVNSEAECISGNPNTFSFLNPNVQAGAEDFLNPAIYNRGIIRVCSTENPGLGTDSSVGTESSRWQEVGNCGNQNLKCWLDRESVKDVIKNSDIEDEVLGEVSEDYLKKLESEGEYIEDFDDLVGVLKELEGNNVDRLFLINKNIDKTFYNNQRAYLHLLRGNIYRDLVRIGYDLFKEESKTGAQTAVDEEKLRQEGMSNADIELLKTATSCSDCKGKGGAFDLCHDVECSALNDKFGNCLFYGPQVLFGGQPPNPTGECVTITSCEDCGKGKGFTNVCDETECSEINALRGFSCEYKDRFWPLSNTCKPLEGTGTQTGTTSLTCTTQTECQKALGQKIIDLASAKKQANNILDSNIKTQTEVNSFECLILLVANLESGVLQCGEYDPETRSIINFQEDNDPLYCEGNPDKVISNLKDEGSFGAMEINTAFKNINGENIGHCGSNGLSSNLEECKEQLSDFDINVNFGIDLLISESNLPARKYVCNGRTYGGWMRAIREYNGWPETDNIDCTKGNTNYVEQVLGATNRNEVNSLFPECA